MHISLPFAGIAPVRDVPGFRGFSKLKRDGVLRTGLETHVPDQGACQAEINKLVDVNFPAQFAVTGNLFFHPDGRVIVEKRKSSFHIRVYDTASGFEADSRVTV